MSVSRLTVNFWASLTCRVSSRVKSLAPALASSKSPCVALRSLASCQLRFPVMMWWRATFLPGSRWFHQQNLKQVYSASKVSVLERRMWEWLTMGCFSLKGVTAACAVFSTESTMSTTRWKVYRSNLSWYNSKFVLFLGFIDAFRCGSLRDLFTYEHLRQSCRHA